MSVWCGYAELVVPRVAMQSGLGVLTAPSRVTDRHSVMVGEYAVTVGPPADAVAEAARHLHEPDRVSLALRVEAVDADVALDVLRPTVEQAVDYLTFQAQAAIHIEAFHVIDVTPALRVGEERACVSQAAPDSFFLPKFMAEMLDLTWTEVPTIAPTLVGLPAIDDSKVQRALWWFVKSLDTPYAIDKYVALWTALECIWSYNNGPRVEQPYKTRCGHEINTCPECNESIITEVRGAGLRRFLKENCHQPDDKVKELWQLRQVVHGYDVFNWEDSMTIASNAALLRAMVLGLLKSILGLDQQQPPLLVPTSGPSFSAHPGIRAVGTRPLTPHDLDIAAEHEALLGA